MVFDYKATVSYCHKANKTANYAQVAQLVEQRTENPRVGGSIPLLGTIFKTSKFKSMF